ncbi:MAG: diguanylate cyclase [Campylobacterota bacterium]|nr:diguanylate cyclase [Campylobacterota bacterium]
MFNYISLKWQYLLMLVALFIILFMGRIYFDNIHYKKMLDHKVHTFTMELEKEFQASKQHVNCEYKMISVHYMNSKDIATSYKNNDKDELYKILKDDYFDFQKINSHLHVMHLLDTNNTSILRMHKPQSFNDNLTQQRPMLEYVNNSLENQYSFDVGKNGIEYRITTPFIHNKKHFGILEFGIRPSYFVEELNKAFQIQSAVLVKTKSLDILRVTKRYKSIGEYSIISNDSIFNDISYMIDLNKKHQLINFHEQTYIVTMNLNLEDYQDETLAKIITIKNITQFVKANDASLILINNLTLSILVIILVILYLIFTKYTKELEKTFKIISKLNEKSCYFEEKSNLDAMTQIYNKSFFNDYLNKFLKLKEDGVLIFFDIDHFKNINDTYGHISGDEILIQLTKTIKEFLRTDDIFVRWGGEEFIVILKDISFDLAVKKANSVRLLTQNTKFINDIPVRISLGVTKIKKDDSKDSLLKRADELLYEAKESGRNCVKSKG